MTVRLDRITTRTGDDGTTALADGTRLPKDHPLIIAIGEVDAANTALGAVRLHPLPPAAAQALPGIQQTLFDLGADLATPAGGPYEERIPRVRAAQVAALDAEIGAATSVLPPLTSFVLPAGSAAVCALHQARVVVRAAERAVVTARGASPAPANPEILRYLNRLSDLLFVWARLAAQGAGSEVLWQPRTP